MREAGAPWLRISSSSNSKPAHGNGALTSCRRTRLSVPRRVALKSASVTSSAAAGFSTAFLYARPRRSSAIARCAGPTAQIQLTSVVAGGPSGGGGGGEGRGGGGGAGGNLGGGGWA